MSVKNCKIGVLIEDDNLRTALYHLLIKHGAIVHCARNEEEMWTLADLLNFDLAVVSVGDPFQGLCMN